MSGFLSLFQGVSFRAVSARPPGGSIYSFIVQASWSRYKAFSKQWNIIKSTAITNQKTLNVCLVHVVKNINFKIISVPQRNAPIHDICFYLFFFFVSSQFLLPRSQRRIPVFGVCLHSRPFVLVSFNNRKEANPINSL